ncbi:MAG: pyruvate kinase [Bacteroidota bacterium]
MKIKKARVERLLLRLDGILNRLRKLEKRYAKLLKRAHPEYRKSALNLVHYLALRDRDLRDVQDELRQYGISRLGRAESHVMASLLAVRGLLRLLLKKKPGSGKPPVTMKGGAKLLRSHTTALLGKKVKGSVVRIMVTLPTEAADDYRLVRGLMKAGMNSARINCAHDGPEVWAKMVANIQKARKNTGRGCTISMDLGGPKLRTGVMRPGPRVIHLHPERDALGNVSAPAQVWLAPPGTAPIDDSRPFLPVDESWLGGLRRGDRVTFQDAREKNCLLRVERREGAGRWAMCYDSAYVRAGTTLVARSGKGGRRREVRLGELPPVEEKILLGSGDTLILRGDPLPGEPAEFDGEGKLLRAAHISCTLPEVFGDVSQGEPILFDDGKIEGTIQRASSQQLEVKITSTTGEVGKLRADKGINLPDSSLRISGLTEKDREDLKFIAKNADIVNVSFVNTTVDVRELLRELKKVGGEHLGVILKIETRRAFENLAEIILTAMRHHPVGIMIARGDLAIECGWRELARVQEEILWMSEAAHVPIILATQVLETLAKKGRPSRAEITDAAMAERAECVMLNKGPHIVQAIGMLDDILTSMQAYHQKKAPLLPALKSKS